MSTQLLKAITNFFVIYIHYVTTWWFYYTLILFSFIGSTKWPLWKIILTLIHSHVLTVSKQDPSAGLPSTLTLSCPRCLSSSALWYEGSSPSPTAPALLGSLPPPGQPWNSNILQFKSVSLIVMVNVFTNSWFISWCFFSFFFNTHLLQMSKAELKDFLLLVVLSEGQSAKTHRNRIFLIPNDTTANHGFQ